jgi:pimeloyl-ACP methyl ester carboxylesterase
MLDTSTFKDFLRTPEECFHALPGFPYDPHYVSSLTGFEGLRMHYIDEGSHDAKSVYVCLHGQLTWSYLFRHLIRDFMNEGSRVLAPDLFGFGRSDKPTDERVHTFEFHRQALKAFIEAMDLHNVTLVVHDFGGFLGLTLPMEMPERIGGLLVMNTFLGTGDVSLGEGFIEWRTWCNSRPDLKISRLMLRACAHLTEREADAYDAPFPAQRYKAGLRSIPNLVPCSVNAPGAAISRSARRWLGHEWQGQSLMWIGMLDPVVTPENMRLLASWIKGCDEILEMADVGHFVPEWSKRVGVAATHRPKNPT